MPSPFDEEPAPHLTICESDRFEKERNAIIASDGVRRIDDQLEELIWELSINPRKAGQPSAQSGIWYVATGYEPLVSGSGITPIVIFYSFDEMEVCLEAIIVAV